MEISSSTKKMNILVERADFVFDIIISRAISGL